jgi:acyl-CoA thioester hydrolase
MLTQHDTHLRVRYTETDPMGFVHHANYLTYFEIARTEMFRVSGGNYRALEEQGLRVVVARATCHYRRPARYDDQLVINTTIKRVTPAKIEHHYRITRDGEMLAEGDVVLAVVNREGVVQRVPNELNPFSTTK